MNVTKNKRVVYQLVDYLKSKSVHCVMQEKYNHKLQRDTYSTGRDFVTAEKMVDQLIKTCEILKLDLTKSGIVSSRGYQVFID